MRFFRPMLMASLALCALAGALTFQNARRADAHIEMLAPASTLGGPITAPLQNPPAAPAPRAPNLSANANAAANAAPANAAPANAAIGSAAIAAPVALPAPPPIAENQRVRVGLSTERGALAIWSANGLILTDLRQPARALRSGPGEIVRFSQGAPVNARSGALVFRGTIALDVGGRKSGAWQWISVAVPGDEPARVTSNGKNARYGRPYRGGFEVFPQLGAEPDHRKNALSLVNVVSMEDYLKGVVPWEMNPTAPAEALKAQAMGARTKALDFMRSKRFAAGRFDICDYDACQGYPGMENEKAASSRAVEQTAGLAIWSGGRPIDAVFCTNSGGITADAGDVWVNSGRVNYLASRRDFAPDSPLAGIVKAAMSETDWRLYCSQSWPSYARPGEAERAELARRRATNPRVAALYGPDDEPEFYRWKREISVEDALRALESRGFSQVTGFDIESRAPSGHIRELRVMGRAKPTPGATILPDKEAAPLSITFQGDGAIRALFSGKLGSTTALPSAVFVVSPQVDADGKLRGWQFNGAGWGHGVGMCQRGAQNHAAQGWDARQIINWYYRDVEIRKVY